MERGHESDHAKSVCNSQLALALVISSNLPNLPHSPNAHMHVRTHTPMCAQWLSQPSQSQSLHFPMHYKSATLTSSMSLSHSHTSSCDTQRQVHGHSTSWGIGMERAREGARASASLLWDKTFQELKDAMKRCSYIDIWSTGRRRCLSTHDADENVKRRK